MLTALTYLFDPLCGWCYGAAPALEKLAATPGIALKLAPTGLFSGEGARPMDAEFAAYAWSNDQRIARMSGQSFSEAYRQNCLLASGVTFDSGPGNTGTHCGRAQHRRQGRQGRDEVGLTHRCSCCDMSDAHSK